MVYLGFLGLRMIIRQKVQWRVPLRKKNTYSPKMKIRNDSCWRIFYPSRTAVTYTKMCLSNVASNVIYFSCSSQTLSYHGLLAEKWQHDDLLDTTAILEAKRALCKIWWVYPYYLVSRNPIIWKLVCFQSMTPNTPWLLGAMAVWNHSSLWHCKEKILLSCTGR